MRHDLNHAKGGLEPVADSGPVARHAGKRLDRPQRQQHGRPAQERAVVARGQAVVDRPAEGVGQECLGEHPDDSEEHPECERAQLLLPTQSRKRVAERVFGWPGSANGSSFIGASPY